MTIMGVVVYALVIALLVTAAAHLLDAALSRLRVATRWVWLGAIALSVLLAVYAPARTPSSEPDAVTSMAVSPGATATTAETEEVGRAVGVFDLLRRGSAVLDRVVARASSALALSPIGETWLMALWGITSLGLSVVIVASTVRLRRRVKSGERERLLDHLVYVSADDFGPATVGLLRPDIVIPRWARQLPEDELGLILQHEAQHARARDPLVLAMGVLLAVVTPWNPLAWFQLKALRSSVELDCDRRVLRVGVSPSRYGELLLRLRSRAHTAPLLSPSVAAPSSLLERRLKAMMKTNRRGNVPVAIVCAIAALGLTALACATQPSPSDSPVLRITVLGDGRLDVTRPGQTEAERHTVSDLAPLVSAERTADPRVMAVLTADSATDPRHVSEALRILQAVEGQSVIVSPRALVASSAAAPPQSPERRVSMAWRDTPIREVLEIFAAFSGRSIEATDAVAGNVTLELDDEPWPAALDAVLDQLGLRSTTDAEGRILVDVAR